MLHVYVCAGTSSLLLQLTPFHLIPSNTGYLFLSFVIFIHMQKIEVKKCTVNTYTYFGTSLNRKYLNTHMNKQNLKTKI